MNSDHETFVSELIDIGLYSDLEQLTVCESEQTAVLLLDNVNEP